MDYCWRYESISTMLTIADGENTGDVEITGETEGASVVILKQKKDDPMMGETSMCYNLDDINDDVICLDTMKYMTGEQV